MSLEQNKQPPSVQPGRPTPGERWTRDALARLRAGGFRPRAWVSFLAQSRERAAQTRHDRPRLSAQVDRWGAAWVALAALGRLAPVARTLPRVPPARELAWAGSWWAMMRWHLGMVEGPAGETRHALSAADAASTFRLWLAPRLLRVDRDEDVFAVLLMLAGASDVLDGALARSSGPSRLGRDLDRFADACAWTAAGLAARRAGWISRPATAAVAGRYPAGLGYALWRYLAHGVRPGSTATVAARALGSCSIAALLAAARVKRPAASRAVAALSLGALAAGAAGERRRR